MNRTIAISYPCSSINEFVIYLNSQINNPLPGYDYTAKAIVLFQWVDAQLTGIVLFDAEAIVLPPVEENAVTE